MPHTPHSGTQLFCQNHVGRRVCRDRQNVQVFVLIKTEAMENVLQFGHDVHSSVALQRINIINS